MDKSKARPRGPSTPNPKRMGVGPESPRESQKEEGGDEATQSESTEKSGQRKEDPKCLPTLVSETSVVGLESPHESKEKESGGGRPGINNAEKCGRSGPSTPSPRSSVVRPTGQHKTGEKVGGGERTWPGAKACERKDEAGEAAKGEAMAGVKNEIGQERSEQTTDQPNRR